MRTIDIENLEIGERQRKTFDTSYISELADSIYSKGLLHAIVLQNDCRTLVAGECRTRAVRMLRDTNRPYTYDDQPIPSGHIPYITLGELTEYDLKEAELQENILRRELPWKERVQAIADLHKMRQEQDPSHTQSDTARELLGLPADDTTPVQSWSTVRQPLILAQHIDDPDVQRAPSIRAAYHIIEKKQRAARLAKAKRDLSTTDHQITHGNALTLLKEIHPNTYDLIITDPPYGINAGRFNAGSAGAHSYDDTEQYAMECYRVLADEGFRVTRDSAFLIAFCDFYYYGRLVDMFTEAGWDVYTAPLIRIKGFSANTVGHWPWQQGGPRRVTEGALFARKGGRHLGQMIADAIQVDPLRTRYHEAEKPVELYHRWMEYCIEPGQKVLDPFCGSGPVFPAASMLNVEAHGSEMNESYYHIARARANGEEPL